MSLYPAAKPWLAWIIPVCLACLGAPSRSGTAAAPASAQEPGWRAIVVHFAQEHFRNPAWGYSHSVRDYRLARQLAAADRVKLDDDVLYVAAFLHDMAEFEPWQKSGVDPADQAAAIVDTVLKNTGFPLSKIDAVRSAIRTYPYNRQPVGPEALYLHDADALDSLGAIGIVRTIELVEPHGGAPTAHEAVSMLEGNLSRIPPRVLSPAGKALVPERKAQIETFLRELREQTDNLHTL